MAKAASTHHTPNNEDGRDQNGHYPFMQKVNGSGGQSKGSRPLSSYLSPEYEQDYPLTSERILENYPFFGTLMKREDGIFKRKEVITQGKPKTIEEVKEIYGPGAYQLRLQTEDRQEEQITFSIRGEEQGDSAKQETGTQVIDQQFIASLRKDLKQEIRADYEDVINRLEKRNQAKEDELNELSSKVRRLNMELAETERTAAKSVREDIKEFETKIDELKEEIQELKFENFELSQELKYADVDGGFNWKESLQEAMKNPDVMAMLQPILAKLFGGQPIPQQPAALGSAPQANGAADQQAAKQGPASPQENPAQPETNQEPSQQPDMQQAQNHLQTFMASVIQKIANALTEDDPNQEAINTFVVKELKTLNSKGVQAPASVWVSISKTLIDYAIQQGISKEKAADVIYPMLQNFGAAKQVLRYTPAKAAANMLIDQFGIEIKRDAQREFLVSILETFKEKVKTGEPA